MAGKSAFHIKTQQKILNRGNRTGGSLDPEALSEHPGKGGERDAGP